MFRLTLLAILFGTLPLSAQNIVLESIGYLVPTHRVEVFTRVPGQVTELPIVEGQRLKKGDVLARLEVAPYQIDMQRADAQVIVTEARLQQVMNAGNAITATEKASAKSLHLRAEADRDMAKYRLDATTIRAPIDGTILTIGTQVGGTARNDGMQAAPICVIADLTQMEVEVDIPERDIRKIRVGQLCQVIVNISPEETLKGEVARVIPQANRAKGTIPVRVKFELGKRMLIPDLTAVVSFQAIN